MISAVNVLNVARIQLNYHEKATNDQLDDPLANAGDGNFTKYARDLWRVKFFNGSKTGVEWCAVFVCWCFWTAYGLETALKLLNLKLGSTAAGVRYLRGFFEKAGRLVWDPQPGDVIFFWPKDRSDPEALAHTGIVEAVDGERVYTIEGNSNNKVERQSYKLSYERIAGYGRPGWFDEEETMAALYDARVMTSGGILNIRSEPRVAKATDIGDIPNGELLQVLEETSDVWAKVVYEGQTGYVQRAFLARIGNEEREDDVQISMPRKLAEMLLDLLENAIGS